MDGGGGCRGCRGGDLFDNIHRVGLMNRCDGMRLPIARNETNETVHVTRQMLSGVRIYHLSLLQQGLIPSLTHSHIYPSLTPTSIPNVNVDVHSFPHILRLSSVLLWCQNLCSLATDDGIDGGGAGDPGVGGKLHNYRLGLMSELIDATSYSLHRNETKLDSELREFSLSPASVSKYIPILFTYSLTHSEIHHLHPRRPGCLAPPPAATAGNGCAPATAAASQPILWSTVRYSGPASILVMPLLGIPFLFVSNQTMKCAIPHRWASPPFSPVCSRLFRRGEERVEGEDSGFGGTGTFPRRWG